MEDEPRGGKREMNMDADRIGVTLTDQNFQATVLESRQPVLVTCWAEGCGPWHLLAPPWRRRFGAR
jgi:thioredoxin-like negative regulator of GroEL